MIGGGGGALDGQRVGGDLRRRGVGDVDGEDVLAQETRRFGHDSGDVPPVNW